MTPYELARAVYDKEVCVRSFDEDEQHHKRSGFVFCTPDFFVMGRPVISTAPAAAIVDPRVRFNSQACDCWHVYLFAGDFEKAWSILPWPLPLLSFERKNDLRFVPCAAIRRLSSARQPAALPT